MSKVTINGVEHRPVEDCGHCWAEAHGEPDPRPHDRWVVTVCDECDELWPCQHAKRVACGDSWEGHECRLPEGHEGDHICGNQDDDEDWCRWTNWDNTPTA